MRAPESQVWAKIASICLLPVKDILRVQAYSSVGQENQGTGMIEGLEKK